MSNDIFAGAISDLERMREAIVKSAGESEDVKNGNCTVQDELQEPAYVLYDQIVKSSIDVLKQPKSTEVFQSIEQVLGTEVAKSMVELFAVTMTHSAHSAIVFYDELLKNELTNQFDIIINRLNENIADIQAYKSVLEVFRKELNDVKSKLIIDAFSKNPINGSEK